MSNSDNLERCKDIIIADSFEELSYKQKKLFLAANNNFNKDRKKYADILIKSLDDGVYNKLRGKFCDQTYRAKILKNLADSGVTPITIKDENYPEYLKNTPVPPLVLYCKGNIKLLNGNNFAVVGSRKTTQASQTLCRQTSATLSNYFNIVTGIAEGADSSAIEGALKSGNIVCVLPNGFDHLYPAGNASLLQRVEQKGLIITEYTAKVPPMRFNFSMRNRIIAGLCKGTLVVSAAQKSGALITANYALEYGRDVFAFPYSVGITSGEGCNALIKKGASLSEGAQDILDAYGIEQKAEEQIELSPDEQKLLSLLHDEGECHLEKIARVLEKKSYQILPVCSSLEIKGLIVKTGGNKYTAVK
jgi:DNA processing protein